MTKLIALFIIASVCGWAQQAKAVTTDERWEYCVAESAPHFMDNNLYEGTVRVCYVTDQGCKEDTVKVTTPVPDQRPNQWQAEAVADRAVAKAMGQLGKDGWELVSVVEPTYPPEGRARLYRKVLYFKRRAR